MKIHSINPVFAVADVGATIRWYEQELGFAGDPFPAHEPYVFLCRQPYGLSEFEIKDLNGYILVFSELID